VAGSVGPVLRLVALKRFGEGWVKRWRWAALVDRESPFNGYENNAWCVVGRFKIVDKKSKRVSGKISQSAGWPEIGRRSALDEGESF
jgi:hypothetical protein